MSLLKRLVGGESRLKALASRAENISKGTVSGPSSSPSPVDLSNPDQVDAALSLVAVKAEATLGLKPYTVQLQGALALIEGNVAEMHTGEGKTLVAALAATVMAMAGRRVHIMTVNDYLVGRDAEFTAHLAAEFGRKVFSITDNMSSEAKAEAYAFGHILYGTPSSFAFDYLRDGVAGCLGDTKQVHGLDVAIIDEVDSILIDEARLPMILSGPDNTEVDQLPDIISLLRSFRCERGHSSKLPESASDVFYMTNEKRAIMLESGFRLLEQHLVESGIIKNPMDLYSHDRSGLMADVDNCLQAIFHYRNGRDYIVVDGKVVMVNPSTGRMEKGRRWSGGLHQAIEAFEGVEIKADSRAQSKITMQSFARLYSHLSGMTGTASADALELQGTYGLNVLPIPPNKPSRKVSDRDRLFFRQEDKDAAILKDAEGCLMRGQPILVGVPSLEEGERLSLLFTKQGINHNLLTAKSHEREAEIISEAGKFGAVTIATNMAGRGTDIILGGPVPEEASLKDSWLAERSHIDRLGGLRVIGTARNDSRRIDLQLQGRAGRQGERGSTAFYLSLDDQLFAHIDGFTKNFLTQAIRSCGGEGLSHQNVDRSIFKAQGLVQGRFRDSRIAIEKVDSMDENQRLAFRSVRESWRDHPEPEKHLLTVAISDLQQNLKKLLKMQMLSFNDAVERLRSDLISSWHFEFDFTSACEEKDADAFANSVVREVHSALSGHIFTENNREIIRRVMLSIMDEFWCDHIEMAAHLNRCVQWRTMAQKKPEQEYSREIHDIFSAMMQKIPLEAVDLSIQEVLINIESEMVA